MVLYRTSDSHGILRLLHDYAHTKKHELFRYGHVGSANIEIASMRCHNHVIVHACPIVRLALNMLRYDLPFVAMY